MVRLTKEFELTVSDIISAIKQLPPLEKKQVFDVFIDEASGIIAYRGKDIPQTIDLEAMMKARGYKGVDWKKFDEIVERLDIQEPIEELLKDLD